MLLWDPFFDDLLEDVVDSALSEALIGSSGGVVDFSSGAFADFLDDVVDFVLPRSLDDFFDDVVDLLSSGAFAACVLFCLTADSHPAAAFFRRSSS